MIQRKPTALREITRAYRVTNYSHKPPIFAHIGTKSAPVMKISRINFSPFKEEPTTNSIQISWIEREENYIALNDRPHFPKLPK